MSNLLVDLLPAASPVSKIESFVSDLFPIEHSFEPKCSVIRHRMNPEDYDAVEIGKVHDVHLCFNDDIFNKVLSQSIECMI